jgi:NADH:ubiquinone oxidoreductase subunit K
MFVFVPQYVFVTFIFIIIASTIFIIFTEYNLLLTVIYLELAFVALITLFGFVAYLTDEFYPIAFSVILLVLAAGDSVIAVSFLVYLNRVGQKGGVFYLNYIN